MQTIPALIREDLQPHDIRQIKSARSLFDAVAYLTRQYGITNANAIRIIQSVV